MVFSHGDCGLGWLRGWLVFVLDRVGFYPRCVCLPVCLSCQLVGWFIKLELNSMKMCTSALPILSRLALLLYHNQAKEGTWIWTDGSPVNLSLYWNRGQPDDYRGGQDCAYVNFVSPGKWDDGGCVNEMSFVCQFSS